MRGIPYRKTLALGPTGGPNDEDLYLEVLLFKTVVFKNFGKIGWLIFF
jgi:hypothetical protein